MERNYKIRKSPKKHQTALGPSAKWRNINIPMDDEYKKKAAVKSARHHATDEDRMEAIARRRMNSMNTDFDDEEMSETEDVVSEGEDFKRQESSRS
jgi:hypothetical protein